MCFSALSMHDPCETCGGHHPGPTGERCYALRAAAESAGLEDELACYLASPEAAFFAWLAQRR